MNKGLDTPRAVALAIDPQKPSTLYLASVAASGSDAFVTKINSAGNALLYSTFIGGGLALLKIFPTVTVRLLASLVDSAANAYVTGLTASAGFPGHS